MLPLTVLGAHRLRYVCTTDASVQLDGLGFSIIYKESRDNCLWQVSVRQPSGPSILRAWFNCLKLRYVLPFEMLWHIWDIRYERWGLRNPLSSERSAQESTDWTGCTHVVIRIKPCVPVAQQLSSCFSVLYGVPLLRTPVCSVRSRPFLFSFFTRSVLLPGKDGTAGRTITRSECVWHVPCPSPRPQHGSASIASNRPQLCDTPCTCLHHLVAFRVLSSVSPNPFLQTLFLYSALRFFGNEVPVIFLWTLISRVHDAALRQPGKSLLEEGVAKQIQRRDLTLTAPWGSPRHSLKQHSGRNNKFILYFCFLCFSLP